MLFGEKPKRNLGSYRIMIIGDDVAVVGDKDGDVDNEIMVIHHEMAMIVQVIALTNY